MTPEAIARANPDIERAVREHLRDYANGVMNEI